MEQSLRRRTELSGFETLEKSQSDYKKLKIFIGIHEIANNVKEFADALSKQGYNVETLAFQSQFYSGNQYNYTLKIPVLFRKNKITRFLYPTLVLPFYLPLIFKYDLFVFVWTTTFLPLNIDLILLRLFGKRVLVFNCGDDVRFRQIQQKIDTELFGLKKFQNKTDEDEYIQGSISFSRALYSQKIEEWTGCQIISTRDQATFQRKDCYLYRFPTTKLLDRPKHTNDVPLIIHAPSNRIVKGTKCVLEAIEILKKEGLRFEFELIEGRNNEYVISRLIAADIVVDQPWMWIAKLASEALAAGCVVVGGNQPEYSGNDRGSPVIQFNPNPDDLAVVLRQLILDKSRRQEIMSRSYEYWEQNYSAEAFVTYFNDLLAGNVKTFSALPDHKDVLLRFASNRYQRLMIRLFY